MKCIFLYIALLAFLFTSCKAAKEDNLNVIYKDFLNPPQDYGPGVYWYFMDGNISKAKMTEDLEAMHKAGIKSVIFLEVNIGIPRGPIDFMSDEWVDCFHHAVKECERLGIEMTLGVGPGWTGSGGPWVTPDKSMRHIVVNNVNVKGNGNTMCINIEKPSPKVPYFGEFVFTEQLKEKWKSYYEDFKVLAFPKQDSVNMITDLNGKALYYRSPYSSAPNVCEMVKRDSDDGSAGFIDAQSVIDVSAFLKGDTLKWAVPEGEWTIMRIGIRNNGSVTRPAPLPGLGFECDKTDTTALALHLEHFVSKLIDTLDICSNVNRKGGLKYLHMDSWEMGAQNYSPVITKEFKKRRGYDMIPFLPVLGGYVVKNKEISERFLWDFRQTLQELVLENHVGYLRNYAHKRGLKLSIEPYDMTPMQDLELGALADNVMCEFWSPGGYNSYYSVLEATSVANIKGQKIIPAEAFTKAFDGWRQHPASMKNQTDWALASGINKFYMHTFQHQCLADTLKPGMTMAEYGIHWDRNQTWWPYVDAFHLYLSRCQYMLSMGNVVSDILYLAPEEAPFVFKTPQTAVTEDFIPDKKGYSFDVCPPSLFYTASVKDHKIVFPSGKEYGVVVLPLVDNMTVELLEKVNSLIMDGAIVVGMPPKATPGLTNYPDCDEQLLSIAGKIWSTANDKEFASSSVGNGKIYYGTMLKDQSDFIYPSYRVITQVLDSIGLPVDFDSSSKQLRYIHKKKENLDIYFVSNKSDRKVESTCSFRTDKGHAYLLNPVSGDAFSLDISKVEKLHSFINLDFEPYESFFVVFVDNDNLLPAQVLKTNRHYKVDQVLKGKWNVVFQDNKGNVDSIETNTLFDWSKSADEYIKYFSGTATYRYNLNLSVKENCSYLIDLGNVKNIAKVFVNGSSIGTLWTTPWSIDVTPYLVDGDNELMIEVTNLWINRLIGDELEPDDGIVNGRWPQWLQNGLPRPSKRKTFATYKHYSMDSPLEKSGLLGPVRLLYSN